MADDAGRKTYTTVVDTGGNSAYTFDTTAALSYADLLTVKNNGSSFLTFGSDGNLGIQTSTPTANLQVVQGTAGVGTVTITGTTTCTGTNTQFLNTFKVGDTITITATGETKAITSITNDTLMAIAAATNTAGSAYTLAGGTRFSVLGNGYVGIGTTAPQRDLHIYGTDGDTRIRLTDTNAGGLGVFEFYNNVGLSGAFFQLGSGAVSYGGANSFNMINVQNAPLILGTNNSVDVTILGSGNTGIGSTTPYGKLDVIGAVTASANYGLLNIGPASTAFDGATAGYFAGDADGTQLAINAVSGFAGDLINAGLNVAGTYASMLYLTSGGTLNVLTGYEVAGIPISTYGEMYAYENANLLTIDTVNVYHAIQGSGLGAGVLSGFTFHAGITGAIASVADGGGGTVIVTDVGHGLTSGDIITIHASTDYDGTYSITRIDDDTFRITAAWTATHTGSWHRGDNLKPTYAGTYKIAMSLTAFAAVANKTFKFEMNKNVTPLDNIVVSRKFSSTDYTPMSASGLVILAANDIIWVSCVDQTDGTDITIRHMNVSIHKL
jgi:hypothetical protein